MAAAPTYELTLKVNFQGELPQTILNLLAESKQKQVEPTQPAAPSAPVAEGATGDYNVYDSDTSSDDDIDMQDASSEASDSEDDDSSIVGAREYWASRKQRSVRPGTAEVEIKQEPEADHAAVSQNNNARIGLGSYLNNGLNNVNNEPNRMANPFRAQNSIASVPRDVSRSMQPQNVVDGSNAVGHQSSASNNASAQRRGAPEHLRNLIFDSSVHNEAVISRQSRTGAWIELIDPEPPGQRRSIAGSITIAIDGAFNEGGKGKKPAVSAIFYSPTNNSNQTEYLPGDVQSLLRAKLYAVDRALVSARQMHGQRTTNLERVIIKSDDKKLVAWLTKKQATGRKNADLFAAIDQDINSLNNMGVWVQFFLVTKGHNKWAAFLANCKVTNGTTATKAMKMQEWQAGFHKDWAK